MVKSVAEIMLPKGALIKKLAAAFVVVIIFYLLFQNLATNYEKLSQDVFSVRYRPMVTSFFILFCSFLFDPWIWKNILAEMDETIDYRQSFSINYLSQLGKYLPGRIWSYVSQVYLAKKEGFPGDKVLLASVILQAMSIFTSLYVFAISFLCWEGTDVSSRIVFFVLSSLLGVILFRGNLAGKMAGLIMNKLLKKEMTINLTAAALYKVTATLLMKWVVYSFAYYFFLQSVYPVDFSSTVIFTGVYAISWLIGYVTLLTPGGIGIREGTQVYLLSFFLPLPIAVIISIASRIWMTVGEIVVSLLALYLMKIRSKWQVSHR